MYALYMMREIRPCDKTKGKLIMTLSGSDVSGFTEGEIIPVIINDGDVNYKVSEARVVKHNIFSVDVELHVKAGMNFTPTFRFEYVAAYFREADKLDLSYLYGQGYKGLDCLTRGRYKRR